MTQFFSAIKVARLIRNLFVHTKNVLSDLELFYACFMKPSRQDNTNCHFSQDEKRFAEWSNH